MILSERLNDCIDRHLASDNIGIGKPEMADLNELYDAATALRQAGDLKASAAKLNEILEIDANYVLAHSALAVTLQKLGQFDDAIEHAVKVTQLEPDDAFSFTQLSVIYQRCGRIPEAEAAMARSHQM